MKPYLKLCCIVLFLTTMATYSMAQPKVDAKAVVDELFMLTKSTSANSRKLYVDKHYILADTQIITLPTYKLTVYKYQPVSRQHAYSFSAIAGQINTAEYDTYSNDDFKAIMKVIDAMDFLQIVDNHPAPGKSLYGKGDYRFIIKQIANAKLTAYTVVLTNLVRTRQLSGVK